MFVNHVEKPGQSADMAITPAMTSSMQIAWQYKDTCDYFHKIIFKCPGVDNHSSKLALLSKINYTHIQRDTIHVSRKYRYKCTENTKYI